MRVHYLASIAGTNLGLLIILAYPMEKELRLVWLPLTAAPYYFLYGRDMAQAGYRLADLFRVYALNLLLLPVNLGGRHNRSERRPPSIQSCHAPPSNGRRIAVVVLHRFQIDLKTDWGINADHRMSRCAPTTPSDGGWVVSHGGRDGMAFRSALKSRSGTSAQRTLPERGVLWERYLVILKHRL